MNSGEEYLDNLLKSLLEGSDANAAGSATQEVPAEPIQNETDVTGASDELALEETDMPDELALEETGMSDELALEETDMPDELVLEETNISDASVDSEANEEEHSVEDFSLSDIGLDDLGLEETEHTESEHDDFMLDDALENLLAGNDEQSDNSLDDSLSDGIALEDLPQDSETESGEMPDDLAITDDALLSEGSDTTDDLALEENGEGDQDLSALLEGMENDEDLSEISELLEKSDQGVSVDDDMLAMLENAPADGDSENGDDMFNFFGEEAVEGEPENIRELTQEESEEREESKKDRKARKKKEKKAKKGRKKKGDAEGQNVAEDGDEAVLESLLEGTAEEKPKKQGFFARLLAFLLEEDEEVLIDNAVMDDSDAQLSLGNLSEENQQLLEDLKKEDQEKDKKKGKKEKKKKEKKSKKGTEESSEDEESEGTEKGKKKKFKRKKKEKKPKEEEFGVPEKKLPRKKVIAVFLYCATIAACIVVVSMVIPSYMQKRDARVAFDHQKYTEVYDLLYGKKLSEEDELLLKKSSTVLQMERKLDSYENYEKLNMPLEALDALISGVDLYRNILPKADEYHVTDEVNDIYAQILERLSDYGISEADALDIIASGDNVTYSQRLESIIYGDGVSAEGVAEPAQDVLPEEEEIINRLEQLEESENADGVEEEQE